MHITPFLITNLLTLITIASAQNAPVVNGNPPGAMYVAVLPDKNDTTVRGTVQIGSSANGTGVNVQISISGLVVSGGPYAYHIHQFPAPALNCTAAGDHLDPYNAGSIVCDPTQPDKCQVGDLSGKHGNMTGPSFTANYLDLYLSTQPGTPAFFGNRSLVVHFNNGTRVSCANFSMSAGGYGTSQATSTATNIVVTAPGPVVNAQSTTTICTSSSTAVQVSTITQVVTAYSGTPTAITAPMQTVTSTTMAMTSVLPQGSTSTTTATIVSTIVVIPPHPSLQTLSNNVTLTQSSNVTVISTVQQPYTIIGTSTILATVVQPSAYTVTSPRQVVQTSTVSGYTQGVTVAPAAVLTVYTTVFSTVTSSSGAAVLSAYTPTATNAVTMTQAVSSLTTVTSSSGGLLYTISSYIFGGSTVTVIAPTTIILTQSQSLAASVVSQIIQVASISAVPGVANVIQIVSVPTGGVTSVLQNVVTRVTAVPSVITNVVTLVTANGLVNTLTSSVVSLVVANASPVVSVVTANGAVNTITQPILSALTNRITATSLINVAVPVATVVPPLFGQTTTISTSIRTVAGKTTTISTSTRKLAITTTTISTSTRTKAGHTTTILSRVRTITALPTIRKLAGASKEQTLEGRIVLATSLFILVGALLFIMN